MYKFDMEELTKVSDDTPSPYQISTNWVRRSSPESIAKGQKSILACVEIVLSFILFWIFANHTPWPWLTLISFLAVPFLLLRSDGPNGSVAVGEKMLQRYWNTSHINFSKRTIFGIFCVAILPLSAVYLYLYTNWLINYQGWSYFWRAMALYVGLSEGAFVVLVVIMGARYVRSTNIFFTIPFVLGVFLRTLFIRFWATVTHLSAGLSNYSFNCRESLLVIDNAHRPEMVPNASKVSKHFSYTNWLQRDTVYKANKFISALTGVTFAVVTWLPALVYRVNLKANAWLWGFIAWVFRPVRWTSDRKHLPTLANAVNIVVLGLLFALVCAIIAVLGHSFLPESFINALKDNAGFLKLFLENLFGIEPQSLRYLALCLLCLSLIIFLILSLFTGNAHGAIYANRADWLHADEMGEAEDARVAGRRIMLVIKCCLISTFLTICVFALWAATHTEFGKAKFTYAIWSFLRDLL